MLSFEFASSSRAALVWPLSSAGARVVFLLILSIVAVEGADEERRGTTSCVPLKYNRVVAHTQHLMAFATAELALAPGLHVLNLCNVTDSRSSGYSRRSRDQEMEEASLRVVIRGDGATVLRQKVWMDGQLLADAKERDTCAARLRELKEREVDAARKLGLLQRADELYNQLAEGVVGQHARQHLGTNETSVAALQQIINHRLDLGPSLQSARTSLEQAQKHASDHARRCTALQRTARVAQLHTSVARSTTVTLEVQHLVAGARWRPQYEVRVDTAAAGRAEIHYNAELDRVPLRMRGLTDVAVELSTGEPVLDQALPVLRPWHLRLMTKPSPPLHPCMGGGAAESRGVPQFKRRQSAAQSKGGREEEVEAAAAEEEEEVEWEAPPPPPPPPPTAVTHGGVSDIFAIPGIHTIVPGHVLSLRIGTINVHANVTRSAVPKLSPLVFLQAELRNGSPYTLLPGKALVHADGSLVAESSVPLVGVGAAFTLDFGVDRSVGVSRRVVVQKESQHRSFLASSGVRRLDREFLLSVHNRRPHAVDLRLTDQVPLPMAGGVSVALSKPFSRDLGAPTDGDGDGDGDSGDGDGVFELREGILSWRGRVEAGSTLEIPVAYTVSVPEGLVLRDADAL